METNNNKIKIYLLLPQRFGKTSARVSNRKTGHEIEKMKGEPIEDFIDRLRAFAKSRNKEMQLFT